MEVGSDLTIFGTGMEVEERSFLWEIKNFPVIVKDDAMIESQRIEFACGEKINRPSKGRVFLRTFVIDQKKWIGVFLKLLDDRPTTTAQRSEKLIFAYFNIVIKDEQGKVTKTRDAGINNMSDGQGWGFDDFIDREVAAPPETLRIHVTLKLYSSGKPTCQETTYQSTLEQFLAEFGAKALKDFETLVQSPITGEVTIVSSDQKEFTVPKRILSARSPVFERMFQGNWTESSNNGKIQLPDITGQGLEVLLNFIYTGGLLPVWKDSGVIIELTNAAAKYELTDLKNFLDLILGMVCTEENATALFTLAHKLELKTAEKELLKFVREKQTNSPENFAKFLSSLQ